jgi:hypothetical protein
MTTRTARSPNYAPTQHSPKPAWISFVLSCKTVGNGAADQRRMWRIDAGSRNLPGIALGLFDMVTVSNRAVVLQIPIAV